MGYIKFMTSLFIKLCAISSTKVQVKDQDTNFSYISIKAMNNLKRKYNNFIYNSIQKIKIARKTYLEENPGR